MEEPIGGHEKHLVSLINAFGPRETEDAFVAVAQVGQSSAGRAKLLNQVQAQDISGLTDSMAPTQQARSPFSNAPTEAAHAAPGAPVAAPPKDMQAELALLTSLLGRHLHQQQQAAAAATAAAAAAPAQQEYSARSGPPPAAAAVHYEDSSYTESPPSAAAAVAGSRGGTATPPVPAAAAAAGGTPTKQGQRVRRKNTDTTQKLQALAEVSEDRLAKQEKRMIKNRESAARSRMRRQQHAEALEEQNAGLQADVAALHTQVAMLQARVNELEWQLQVANAAAGGSSRPSTGQPGGGLNSLQLPASLSLSLPQLSGMQQGQQHVHATPEGRAAAAAPAAPVVTGSDSAGPSLQGCGGDAAGAVDALAALRACSRRGSSTDSPAQPASVAAAAASAAASAAAAAMPGGSGASTRATESAIAALLGGILRGSATGCGMEAGASAADDGEKCSSGMRSRLGAAAAPAATAAAAAGPRVAEPQAGVERGAMTVEQQQEGAELAPGMLSLLTAALMATSSKVQQEPHLQQQQQWFAREVEPHSSAGKGDTLTAVSALLAALQHMKGGKEGSAGAAAAGCMPAAAVQEEPAAAANGGPVSERPAKRVCS